MMVFQPPINRKEEEVKMAEVGQRVGSCVYRFSAIRTSPGLPACTGESPGSLRMKCTVSDSWIRGESTTQGHREVQSGLKRRATQHKSGVRITVGQQENRTCLELYPARSFRFAQTRESQQVYVLGPPVRLQPALHERLLPGRVAPSWTGGALSIRHHQQLRALCTAIFIVAERGPEKPGCPPRPRCLKRHPETLRRSSSWRSDSGSLDAPPLYRSRTAFYDILQVSPSATQSQIKTAYYKQSFIYHPDKNPGNEAAAQRFSEISQAYTVLGNTGLRRKYDRGVLSQSDIQSAGRPSSKETVSRPTGAPKQQQHQQRARRFSQAGETSRFDFDAFYQAHYGEQLRREKDMRARKQRMQEQQKESFRRWKQGKMMEMVVVMVLAMAGLIFVNLSRS